MARSRNCQRSRRGDIKAFEAKMLPRRERRLVRVQLATMADPDSLVLAQAGKHGKSRISFIVS
jgi:hypothetical protein